MNFWVWLIGIMVCWFLIFCVAFFLEGSKHSAHTDTPWALLVLGAIGLGAIVWPITLPPSLLVLSLVLVHVLFLRLGKKYTS